MNQMQNTIMEIYSQLLSGLFMYHFVIDIGE